MMKNVVSWTNLALAWNLNSNQITKFIFTKSDNLSSLSLGYTWCGANEVASHPKTPTLEKAAALDKGLSESSLTPALVEEEEFPTRSRVAALKQMSVASIASLRQRLSESRKIFDRKISQHTVSYFSGQEIFHWKTKWTEIQCKNRKKGYAHFLQFSTNTRSKVRNYLETFHSLQLKSPSSGGCFLIHTRIIRVHSKFMDQFNLTR